VHGNKRGRQVETEEADIVPQCAPKYTERFFFLYTNHTHMVCISSISIRECVLGHIRVKGIEFRFDFEVSTLVSYCIELVFGFLL